jgi:predicted nucleic acid-binding Zn ribbon protein
MQKFSDRPVSRCEKCNERVTRVFHPVAIHFKGSGFYSTDYGKKRSGQGKAAGEKSEGKQNKGKDKKAQDSRKSKKKAAAGSKES